MQLGYDKDAFGTFTKKAYNGNIAGSIWRSAGDGIDRKYDYDYDNANRLLKADFTQHDGTAFATNTAINFNVKMGDGIDPNLAYDYNGNILKMQQWGLKINTSPQIDNLIYNYIAGSNKLARVSDVGAIASDNGKLGDFKDGTNTNDDYLYDANGNLNLDNNKAISSITYNHLNLPSVINVTGRGSIAYTYDAGGNKLRKVTLENPNATNNNKTITTTTNYINGLVYESKTTSPANTPTTDYTDVLQFVPQEEGRIRFKPAILNASGTIITPANFAYDYLLKDHLGNVRVVITEEQKVDPYPAATMEAAQTATEESFYTGLNTTRIDKPVGYPVDNTTTPNDKVAKVNGSGNKIGPSITLKVMAGDKFNVKVSSWYKTNGAPINNPTTPILTDLINGFLGGVGGAISSSHGTTTTTQIQNSGVLTPNINNFLSTQVNDPSRPKAYLNWILFDEQFNFVSSSSNAEQVPAESEFGNVPNQQVKLHVKNDLPINKSGYLYVYVSNETPNIDVFFDNLQVTHTRGAMLSEDHYYPFGLRAEGISSRAAGSLENKRKWNAGSELQPKEFIDGSGLELYSTFYRSLDPQLGRFWQIDPKPNYSQSLYSSMNNNPISINDPLGDTAVVRWKSGFLGLKKNEARYVNGNWINSKNRKAININKVSKGYAKDFMNDYNGLNDNKQFSKLTNKINTSETNVVFNRTASSEVDPKNKFRDNETNELVVNISKTVTLSGALNEGNVPTTANSQIAMGHELSHVYDKLNGNFEGSSISISSSGVFLNVSGLEKNAMYYENILKNQLGIPLRNSYEVSDGNLKVRNGNALINRDANGKPISISNLNGDTYDVN